MSDRVQQPIDFREGNLVDETLNAKRRNWRRRLWRELRKKQAGSVFEELSSNDDGGDDDSANDG